MRLWLSNTSFEIAKKKSCLYAAAIQFSVFSFSLSSASPTALSLYPPVVAQEHGHMATPFRLTYNTTTDAAARSKVKLSIHERFPQVLSPWLWLRICVDSVLCVRLTRYALEVRAEEVERQRLIHFVHNKFPLFFLKFSLHLYLGASFGLICTALFRWSDGPSADTSNLSCLPS